MSSYEKIKEIYRQQRLDYFVMACSYFFDIGYAQAKELTEDDIDKAEGNGLMTKEFVQFVMRTAKEIAEVSESPIDLVQFCMAEDVFDIRLYANKVPKFKLEQMVEQRLSYDEFDFSKVDDIEKACEKYDCDAEDFEMLGYEITEKYFE